MWVVLDPLLLADGAVAAVRAGGLIEAALVLETDGSLRARDAGPVGGGGNITPAPAGVSGAVGARYRVTGIGVLRGKRAGVEAGGLFVLSEDPAPVPGRPFDATGELHLTTWLVSRTVCTAWLVHTIMLHTAPVPVREAPGASGRTAERADVAAPGARLMTAQQYVEAIGAQQAHARGVWVRGAEPDYSAGTLEQVEQAVALGRDPVGTARRYLLDVQPAPRP